MPLEKNKLYRFKNRGSGMYLSLKNASHKTGTRVEQRSIDPDEHDNNNPNSFIWYLEDAGGDYVYIRSKHGGKYLSIYNDGKSNGKNACLGMYEPEYVHHSTESAKFQLLHGFDYYFKNKNSSKFLRPYKYKNDKNRVIEIHSMTSVWSKRDYFRWIAEPVFENEAEFIEGQSFNGKSKPASTSIAKYALTMSRAMLEDHIGNYGFGTSVGAFLDFFKAENGDGIQRMLDGVHELLKDNLDATVNQLEDNQLSRLSIDLSRRYKDWLDIRIAKTKSNEQLRLDLNDTTNDNALRYRSMQQLDFYSTNPNLFKKTGMMAFCALAINHFSLLYDLAWVTWDSKNGEVPNSDPVWGDVIEDMDSWISVLNTNWTNLKNERIGLLDEVVSNNFPLFFFRIDNYYGNNFNTGYSRNQGRYDAHVKLMMKLESGDPQSVLENLQNIRNAAEDKSWYKFR